MSGLSVSNLVNLSNLERVFSEIFGKLSTINKRMDKMESDIASNVSLSNFLSLKNEYESNTNLFENRIKYLEENVSSIKPIIQKSTFNAENIDKLRDKQKECVTAESFQSSMSDFEEIISDKLEQISSAKSSNHRTKKLEESTKGICAQISAMESMLQCKVDKSQIPLVQSCQKQLDSLETFRDCMSQRVAVIDDQIAQMNEDLDTKIQKQTFEEFQSDATESISKKSRNVILE